MLFFLWIAVLVLANAEAYTHEEANAYIDKVLEDTFVTEQTSEELDPYNLPDIHVPLISKGETENQATLSKGRLINLSRPRRSGKCSLPRWQFANLTFTCTVGFPDNLQINYTANVNFDNMQLVFYPKTVIQGTEIMIQVTTTKRLDVPSLKLFLISDIGQMKVTTTLVSVGTIPEKIEPPIREALVSKSTINLHKVLNGHFQDVLSTSILKTPVSFIDN